MVPFQEKDLTGSVRELERWYQASARALPWRKSRDPYRIWISEVMLQQTQVATVIPYYERFLQRFPDLAALAEANEEDVLSLWSGLGYYSRAKNLHRGANDIVARFRGEFPRDRALLLSVPGIGPYTAGAILSIAFDLAVPIVDGNVQRVFSRVFAIPHAVETKEASDLFWKKATEWVEGAKSPRVLNQAVMELGATICVKGTPLCNRCPLSAVCLARAKGEATEFPRRKARRKPIELFWQSYILESRGKYFLRFSEKGEWWSGLWDLPRIEVKNGDALLSPAPPYGVSRRGLSLLGCQKHTVTHHRIRIAAFHASLRSPSQIKSDGAWFSRAEIEALPVSSLVRKIFQSLSC